MVPFHSSLDLGIITPADTFFPETTGIRQSNSVSSVVTDGKKIYVGSLNGTIRGWSLTSTKHEGAFVEHRDVVNEMTILNDGTMVSAGDDSSIIHWSTKSYDKIRKFNGPEKAVSSCLVIQDQDLATSLKISKEDRVVIGGSWDGKVYMWDIRNANPVRVLLGHPAAVKKIAYFETRHGKSLASGCNNGELWVWDLKKFTVIHKVQAHLETICHLKTHGGILMSSGKDTSSGRKSSSVKIWDRDLKPVDEVQTGQEFVNKIFVFQNRFLVTASTQAVEVWDKNSNKEVIEKRQNNDIVVSATTMNDDTILVAKSRGVSLVKYVNKKMFLLKSLHKFRTQMGYPPVMVKYIFETFMTAKSSSSNN